jgi:hypothetical protein
MEHGAGRGPGHRAEPAAALTLRRSVGAVIGDAPLADGLRALLRLDIGIHVGLFGLLEIGQLEELTYYVILFGFRGPGERYVKWQKDRLSLEEAIGHFLRLRHAHEFGFDYEVADGGRDRETG